MIRSVRKFLKNIPVKSDDTLSVSDSHSLYSMESDMSMYMYKKNVYHIIVTGSDDEENVNTEEYIRDVGFDASLIANNPTFNND